VTDISREEVDTKIANGIAETRIELARIDGRIDTLTERIAGISTIATIQFRIMYAFQAVLLSAIVGLYFKH
jgi:hypothetical protein